MELDVTEIVADMLANDTACTISASHAELGENAGSITWANALTYRPQPLTEPEHFEAFREFAGGFGAWDDDEIAAWSDDECNALCLQFIAGDLRELQGLAPDEDGGIDWPEAEKLMAEGTVSARLYGGSLTSDGRTYFDISE